VTDLESSSLQDYAFDSELRASTVYSRAQTEDAGAAEAEDPHHAISMEEQQSCSATSIQSESSKKHIATPSSSGSAEVQTISTSFVAGVEGLSEDRHADKVKRDVYLTDDHDECQMLSALLDTGATCNCISEAKFASLKVENEARKCPTPVKLRAANGEIMVTLVVKARWRFPKKARLYTNLFYVVPDLGHDVVICRNVIFDHDLLMDNPELCSLGLPDELKKLPELYVLGMKKLSKGKIHESLRLSKALLTPMKTRRRSKMGGPRQRRRRTRHRGTRRPRSGLQLARRLPVRLQIRAIQPAAADRPTRANEVWTNLRDLYERARPGFFSVCSVQKWQKAVACSAVLTMSDQTIFIRGLDWHQDSVTGVGIHRCCRFLVPAALACRQRDRSVEN
jgi:hypothetical protein